MLRRSRRLDPDMAEMLLLRWEKDMPVGAYPSEEKRDINSIERSQVRSKAEFVSDWNQRTYQGRKPKNGPAHSTEPYAVSASASLGPEAATANIAVVQRLKSDP